MILSGAVKSRPTVAAYRSQHHFGEVIPVWGRSALCAGRPPRLSGGKYMSVHQKQQQDVRLPRAERRLNKG